MNLKATLQKKRGNKNDNIEMTPVMNLFLILVPFLLFTATFVNIAILELSLPQINKARNLTQQDQPPKQSILSTLEIREEGFALKSPTFNFPIIGKRNEAYDFEALLSQLNQIRQKFPDAQDMVIAPQDMIKYDTVISVMDRLRETGFPNISISG